MIGPSAGADHAEARIAAAAWAGCLDGQAGLRIGGLVFEHLAPSLKTWDRGGSS